MTFTVFALTEAGLALAKKIEISHPNTSILFKPKHFKQRVRDSFFEGKPIILICAMGIAVRILGPVIADKKTDPPVLVMDDQGKYIIPILSGHEGGANFLAHQLSTVLSSQVIITGVHSYTHPVYSVGMGCERHCDIHHLKDLLLQALREVNLTHEDINCLASIDIKSDEKALIQLAKEYGWEFKTWGADTLRKKEHLLSTKSEIVFNEVGVYGVAESAALVCAESFSHIPSELILKKIKNRHATCAIAKSYFEENVKHKEDEALL